MNLVSKIKTLLKEAELYGSQGLLNEALAKYEKAAKLIKESKQLQSKENLVKGIKNKINLLKKKIDRVEKAPTTPEVPEKIQNLIKNMFAFSSATQGWVLTKTSGFERLMLLAVVPFMLVPNMMASSLLYGSEYVSYLLGTIIYVLVYFMQRNKVTKQI